MASASTNPTSSPTNPTLLVIGATGVTGRAALDGLLASGVVPAANVVALTRSKNGSGARAVAELGVNLAEGDLDSETDDVANLLATTPSLRAVYIHALSADAATADPRELERASRLALQLRPAVQRQQLDIVLYNSSAGKGAGSGISQVEQKHAVEEVLSGGGKSESGGGGGGGESGGGVPFCAFQCSMFFEELWKKYTRPAILEKGKFMFSIPPDVPVHLVAARDLGTATAAALRDPKRFAALKELPLAGDALTPTQLCAAFEKAAKEAATSGSSSSSSSSSAATLVATAVTQQRFPPLWLTWLLNKDLYRIVRFLSTPPGYGVDVAAARRLVPGLLTFDEFLRRTGWADPGRTYEQGVRYDEDGVGGIAAGGGGGLSPVPVAAAGQGGAGDEAAAE
jgi:uncharacterized protein YbjT (DUF2867 family)